MPRTIQATRYVTPFREGGSHSALIEANVPTGLTTHPEQTLGCRFNTLVRNL